MENEATVTQNNEQLFSHSEVNKSWHKFPNTLSYEKKGWDRLGFETQQSHQINQFPKEEYHELIQMKKDILVRKKKREIWTKTNIKKEIFDIIELLDSQELKFEDNSDDITSSSENKTIDAIDTIIKRKIHQKIRDYFLLISAKFDEFDFIEPMTTEIITSKIKAHYLLLRKQQTNQTQIFDEMVTWLQSRTK